MQTPVVQTADPPCPHMNASEQKPMHANNGVSLTRPLHQRHRCRVDNPHHSKQSLDQVRQWYKCEMLHPILSQKQTLQLNLHHLNQTDPSVRHGPQGHLPAH